MDQLDILRCAFSANAKIKFVSNLWYAVYNSWLTSEVANVFTFCSRQMDVVKETGGLIREPIITIFELSDYAQGLDEKDKRHNLLQKIYLGRQGQREQNGLVERDGVGFKL
ncbi:hypothetical protein OUZ56_003484 [Daphnia magna]|uniref:Uncharacterized protein n=1 Tax=Daphnia magna TaxID=35525 RepID=A0ABR0A8X0_9CRUS|nr:hypothetical protein OUZ56_003484 [Daphnia magna]